MKNENYDDNENSMTAEEFLDFMRKNRRTVPNEKRIANKDKFIWAVSELSETYEIDADLIEDDDGYTASLYMNYASYNPFITSSNSALNSSVFRSFLKSFQVVQNSFPVEPKSARKYPIRPVCIESC